MKYFFEFTRQYWTGATQKARSEDWIIARRSDRGLPTAETSAGNKV
jgi:hypothetical protein